MRLSNVLANVVGGLLYSIAVSAVLFMVVLQNILDWYKKMDWKNYLKNLGRVIWSAKKEEVKARIDETIEDIEDKIDEELGYESARPKEDDKV